MAKTLKQKMCKRSLGYAFTRNFFVRPAFYLFYRRVDVIGEKDVPDEGPVIFTPNHQNALMDALSILCTKNRQPVFMARADIFQKPIIIKILNFLRILPIFRKRDGGSSSDNNQETFDIILSVLQCRLAIGIMPEGIHNEVKRLRVLQKGVFRLAMQAQEEHGNRPAVKIIPVGIEYSDTHKFRSNVIVNYGKAMEVSDYYDLYLENPARAFKVMQDTLSEKMRTGMIHIENETYYFGIERIRVFYQEQAARLLGLDCRIGKNRLFVQQKIVAVLQDFAIADPSAMDELCGKVKEYTEIVEKYNIRDWVVRKQPYGFAELAGRSLLALLAVPFWLSGLLLNYIPYKISDIGSRTVKDKQFVSSVQYVLGLVFYPLYHVIIIVLSLIFIPCIWGKLLMIILPVPCGLIAFRFYLSMKKLSARYRFRHLKQKKNPEILKSIELRKDIFGRMDEWMQQAGK